MEKKDISILTNRELEVITLLINGATNEEIAKQLYISSHTVKAHLESIYRKLNLHNKVQVAVYAILSGLIKIE